MAKKTQTPPKQYTEAEKRQAFKGRRIAIALAGVGIYWIAATWLGGFFDISQRYRALLDLIALAGFGWVLWEIFQFWRASQSDNRK